MIGFELLASFQGWNPVKCAFEVGSKINVSKLKGINPPGYDAALGTAIVQIQTEACFVGRTGQRENYPASRNHVSIWLCAQVASHARSTVSRR